MTFASRTPPDPRALFDQSMETVKASCSELEPAIDRRDPQCVSIAQNAVYAWLSARSACRALLSAGRSGAPDPFGGAARRLLESRARVLTDQLIRAAQLPFSPSACIRLKELCSLLMKATDAPLVDGDVVARNDEGRGSARK